MNTCYPNFFYFNTCYTLYIVLSLLFIADYFQHWCAITATQQDRVLCLRVTQARIRLLIRGGEGNLTLLLG